MFKRLFQRYRKKNIIPTAHLESPNASRHSHKEGPCENCELRFIYNTYAYEKWIYWWGPCDATFFLGSYKTTYFYMPTWIRVM